MSLPNPADRRPSGPDDPVTIGVDPATLQLLLDLRERYGDIVAMQKPNGREAWFINDAAEVRRILVRRHTKYRKGPGFERVKMLLGNGLIVSDGNVWRRSRTMVQPAFGRQKIDSLIELMIECSERRSATWAEIAEQGEPINITQQTSGFALELILRATFGVDYERRIIHDGANPFAFLSDDATRDLGVVLKVRNLRDLILSVIEERRASNTGEEYDFLSIYIHARDKDGNGFTDDELLDEVITLIVAGYETSAGTLNWAWHLLACNPEADEALLTEARSIVPDATSIDSDVLKDMVYAQALLEETLRLYPPVWLFSRRADHDDVLTDYDVPAGTDIYFSPYILHRTPEYWPEPDRFYPDRFGPNATYKKGDRPYFPFSLGPRRCLGEYFSFLEMKVHLGMLIQRFRMTPVNDAEPELDLGINLRTKNEIWLKPELRGN